MNVAAPTAPRLAGPSVEIDLSALCDNYAMLAKTACGAETAAVVKCDGYGLGMARVADALARRAGCRTFFVAYAQEGAALRAALKDAAPDALIYVFAGPDAASAPLFLGRELTPVINSADQARLWAEAKPDGACALHVETGMNRLGLPPAELGAVTDLAGFAPGLVMSHLACSAAPGHPMNEAQRAAFVDVAAAFPTARRSLAASGGVLMDASCHFDLVRPGVALYGASPFSGPDARIRPVARLTAPILQLRDLEPGDTVGYNAAFTARRKTRIGVVALGYGDGFPVSGSSRGGSGGAEAVVNGARVPVAGRVSMDLICLDVTDAAAAPGDLAEFYGPALDITEAATACGTIPYELLTGLGGRVDRRYL